MKKSWIDSLIRLTKTDRAAFLDGLTPEQINLLLYDWRLWARPKQLPPAGDWRVWLLMAGRGFGKTRAGAEWIRWLAHSGRARRIALVGETFDDARQVMVEGASGILSVCPNWARPAWRAGQRTLIWPSGTVARCYSADDPEQLRGPEFDYAWADEIAKWRYPSAWDNLMLALRVGNRPQCIATTTPRPLRWLSDLAAAEDTVLVQGASRENATNLSPNFMVAMHRRFGDSHLARQELDGIMMSGLPDALWQRHDILRLHRPMPKRHRFIRIVIGVDPAMGGGDETGIITAGKDQDGHIWILADDSLHAPPDKWAAQIQKVFRQWRADSVIAEVNQGGSLIRTLLAQAGSSLPVREVRAMRAKSIRAEPVAAAYARGDVSHAGQFGALEDQMCSCVPGQRQMPSPDRLDAMVWAVNALLGGIETATKEMAF